MEPKAAIEAVLAVVRERIGDRGQWLNSYELIGKRLTAPVRPRRKRQGRAQEHRSDGATVGVDDQRLAQCLEAIQATDRQGAVVNPVLYQRTRPLGRLLRHFQEVNAEEIITSVVARCLINGNRVNGWKYFEQAIVEASEKSGYLEAVENWDPDDASAEAA